MATARGTKAKALGGLGQWWGVLTGLLLVAAWVNSAAGPASVAALSALTLLWCLFQAPVTCGALVRSRGVEDGCRNNASGLLLGCHIRQHRWQKVKLLLVRRKVKEFFTGLFSDGKASVVTLAGLGSLMSGIAALIPGLAIR
ncbi:hypothetical protein [Streptomyces sp. NPDC097619]|uniref:hypothetical protein n=1 Tax=Streptomyces sp. NPDC097619 TaxID=3157228 RepID=UPI00331DD9B8